MTSQCVEVEARAAAALPASQRTPAALAGLPRLETVDIKALSDASGLSIETLWRRCRLFESDPANPLALPFIRSLGRPYRVRRIDALRFLEAIGA